MEWHFRFFCLLALYPAALSPVGCSETRRRPLRQALAYDPAGRGLEDASSRSSLSIQARVILRGSPLSSSAFGTGPQARVRSRLAALARPFAGASASRPISIRVSTAGSVCRRQRSRSASGCYGRPPGLPDRPFWNGMSFTFPYEGFIDSIENKAFSKTDGIVISQHIGIK
jgi:hypothetical protein